LEFPLLVFEQATDQGGNEYAEVKQRLPLKFSLRNPIVLKNNADYSHANPHGEIIPICSALFLVDS